MLQARLLVLAAIVLGAIASLGFGARQIYKAGYRAASLDHVENAQLIANAATAVEKTTAEAISKIHVKHVTIRQNLEKELTRDVIYRDCVASDRVLGLTNDALTGSRADTVTDSVVPSPEPVN